MKRERLYVTDSVIEGNTITFWDDDLEWNYTILEGDVKKAEELMYEARDRWYDTYVYPEYECCCIGDVIDELLDEAGIKYESR